MDNDHLTEIFESLGSINSNLKTINSTLQKVDKTLNDDKYGLKMRTALLESSNNRRHVIERIVVASVIGIVARMLFVAIT